jgi:hypothetical protein
MSVYIGNQCFSSDGFHVGSSAGAFVRALIETVSLFADDVGYVGCEANELGGPSAAQFHFHGLLPENCPVALHRALFLSDG